VLGEEMRSEIIFTGVLFLLLIQGIALADDNFKVYLSKEKYTVGEDVVINVEIANQAPEESDVFWYISFTPDIQKYPMTLIGSATIQPNQTYYETHSTKIEMPGDITVLVDFYDSEDNLLGEETLKFSASEPINMYLLLIAGIGAIIIFSILIILFKKRKERWKKLMKKYK
jgi:hypothetical protein